MTRVKRFTHEFVEFVPDVLDKGVLYVSLPYTTVVHLCACGCGSKVVSALDPTDYALTFDGDTISLWPSIGNWDYHCRSHYVIRQGEVLWMGQMSDADIAAGRDLDRFNKQAREAGADQDQDQERVENGRATENARMSLVVALKAIVRRLTRRPRR